MALSAFVHRRFRSSRTKGTTAVNRATEPALIFALDARVERGSARYPRSELARGHGIEGLGETAVDAYGDLVAEQGQPPELPDLSGG